MFDERRKQSGGLCCSSRAYFKANEGADPSVRSKSSIMQIVELANIEAANGTKAAEVTAMVKRSHASWV